MNITSEKENVIEEEFRKIQVCADLDEDCPDVECHLSCWLYDMGRGRCPYLSEGKP